MRRLRDAAWPAALLALFVTLVWLRMPEIMRHGRFWAEEGRIYYTNAVTLLWWQALLRPEMGYLNLPANLATLCARHLVALRDAPHVTTAIALILQTLPAMLLVTARDAWLRPPPVRLAAVLLLALPPGSDEIWLSTTTSQFHIAVAASLCLALDVSEGAARAARLALVCAAPLCGPISIALAPLFVLRAAIERHPARLLMAAGILAGSAVQLMFFVHVHGMRTQPWTVSVLVAVLAARHLALPLLGHDTAVRIAAGLRDGILHARVPYAAAAVLLAAGSAVAAALAMRRRATPAWLAAAALALGAFCLYGALAARIELISVDAGMRYAAPSLLLTGLTVLAIAATGRDRLSVAAGLLTVWLLAAGCVQFVRPHPPTFAQGPRWRDEVARWHANPSYAPRIWPEGWAMPLSH